MNKSNRLKLLAELPCRRDWKLDDSKWSDQAWMSKVDLQIIDNALGKLAANVSSCVKCFEWGSGRSTLYFTSQLAQAERSALWISVEYNLGWFNQFVDNLPERFAYSEHRMNNGGLAQMPDDGTHFLLFDYGELLPMHVNHSQDREVQMNDYVNCIGSFDNNFDFVLVDGRKRNQCLYAASQKLSETGIAFLHDAWRPYYSLGSTFFCTALRAGENLMVASHMQLQQLLDYVDVANLCNKEQIQWTQEI